MAEIQIDDADAFIAKWLGVTASELSTSQSFLADLCRLLGVDTPHPTPEQDYMFERPITFLHGDGSSSPGRIDLYRRGAFVLESKKLKVGTHTKGFDDALLRARSQAEGYARALPANEGRPPFVVVVDVGNRIELYSEFSRSGATYTPFPDPRSYQLALVDLRKPEIRERLRQVWLDPLALDPSRESARVTREIATRLATLARSLESAKHAPELVAQFLMRCLFTMFAEDVKLLPSDSFRDLLIKHAEQPDIAMRMLGILWQDMDRGGFCGAIANDVLRFNGKLFKQPDTLPLDKAQLQLLILAAKADWRHVEPAIFGTLLERALTPGERHKLGAHYTPRAYVERLVLPTVIEPLRAEWSDAQAAALTLDAEGKQDEAIAQLRRFHHRLCNVRVLDPACGSGNFLYVTLEHLKRLEGEVLNALDGLGARQTGLALGGERFDATTAETVDPHNLLGIELNPRAAAIAEVVLWIGYLQWHFRTRGDVQPPQPVIRDFHNIENRDAVLAYDRMEYVTDERGVPVTRWDGVTMKKSPVTGEDIPDESAQKPVERYVNPRKAEWPAADFVVGNPPFIGKGRIRSALGDGYVEALRATWPAIPESADLVMYWWHQAALLVRGGAVKRFGLITTNSIRQAFNRRVLDPHLSDKKQPLFLVFAIPDHPWVDSADGAAVRIAITVGSAEYSSGQILISSAEKDDADGAVDVTFRRALGRVNADLSSGTDVSSVPPLTSNGRLSNTGLILGNRGFVISRDEAAIYLSRNKLRNLIAPLRNGDDLVGSLRDLWVIDPHGLSESDLKNRAPELWQHLYDRVKPEREQNRDPRVRSNWWLFRRSNEQVRKAIAGLPRFIVTSETSKHRIFQFVEGTIKPEHKLVVVASDKAHHLGILFSTVHVVWALAAGSRLGVGNDPVYNKTRCFETFAFPAYSECQQNLIRDLAEQLDAHRKRQQAAHPDLTLTGMYNVLGKLRSGETLTVKERTIHEQGLVSVLRQLHDELDAAVLDAYGWADLLPLLRMAHGNSPSPPAPLPGGEGRTAESSTPDPDCIRATTRDEAKRAFDEAILERLVALNAERAAEETRGLVRWLRPEFQNPQEKAAPTQTEIDTDEPDEVINAPKIDAKPLPWPKDTIDQVRAVADTLAASVASLSPDDIATRFSGRGPWKKRLPQLLDMLVALGRAREKDGRYFGAK